ncbi:cysteine desulfurase family protein [Methanogenium organophilum]|uniref:cysteine desulfurase n=1 Tax=Methanogenium organophilum TaxID=2199 RepID=A0A9X9S4N1_METOG|nr:cysteine desulfurase family protein [Methanogenium organophilum]WAI01417.1 cysteine desulfurase family protein [Methanogenium organophilum]
MSPSDVNRDVEDLLKFHGVPKREVYLDAENSGPVFPEALEVMRMAYLGGGRGHPSITHRIGWETYETLFTSSQTVADAMHCVPEELVYTHSGTEANNLAITGLAQASKERKKIIVSAIEHLSVMFPAERLEEQGYRVVKIPVDDEGFVDTDTLSRETDEDTLLVSIAPLNHEIGVMQDIHAIVDTVKDKDEGVMVHFDACDAFCRTRLELENSGIDMASFSSHKIFGPKGVGVLYVRDGTELEPIIRGQLSTQKLWAGVENIPGIVGFAKAVEMMQKNGDEYLSHMTALRDRLTDGILGEIEGTLLNGPMGERRAPDNVNISFLNCEGEAMTVEMSLKGVYVSSGSACTSRVLEPSHVLLAIRRKYEEAHGSILMKTTPFLTDDDIEYVLTCFPEAARRIRSLSPFTGV